MAMAVCNIITSASVCATCKQWVIPPMLTLATLGGLLGLTETQIRARCTHSVHEGPVEEDGQLKDVPKTYCPTCCPVCNPKVREG